MRAAERGRLGRRLKLLLFTTLPGALGESWLDWAGLLM